MVQIPITTSTTPARRSQPIPRSARPTAAAISQMEPLMMPFTIIYDRQERAGGWRFADLTGNSEDKYRPLVVPTREEHLKTADYTVEGVSAFVERKSVEDFLGTIIHGRERFQREHERMNAIEAAGGNCLVIIEGNLDQILADLERPDCMRKIHPNSVRGSIAAFELDYGITWAFAGSRRVAEELAFSVLRKAWERAQEKK